MQEQKILYRQDNSEKIDFPALGEASRYRGLGSSLHTFVVGNPATTLKQNDLAITSISTSPTPWSGSSSLPSGRLSDPPPRRWSTRRTAVESR